LILPNLEQAASVPIRKGCTMTLPIEPPKDEQLDPTGHHRNSGQSYSREMRMTHVIPLYLGVTVIIALVGAIVSGSNNAFEIVIRYAIVLFGVLLLCRFDRRLGEIRDELRKRS